MKFNYFILKGFSLIELMIVVAVIALLAAIAYPSYRDYLQHSRRVDAQSVLLNIQLSQEKYRVNNPAYGALGDLDSTPYSEYYNFAVSGTSATAYNISATAKSGTSQANDTACLSMSIDQASNRTPADCWKK